MRSISSSDMIRQLCRRLHHAPGVARGADTTAFAAIGDAVVMPAVTTAGPGHTVSKDAAFEVFAKRLAHTGLWDVVVALPVELAGSCQRLPDLEVLGNCWVQQGALGVARVVELGLDPRWPARVRMRVR